MVCFSQVMCDDASGINTCFIMSINKNLYFITVWCMAWWRWIITFVSIGNSYRKSFARHTLQLYYTYKPTGVQIVFNKHTIQCRTDHMIIGWFPQGLLPESGAEPNPCELIRSRHSWLSERFYSAEYNEFMEEMSSVT